MKLKKEVKKLKKEVMKYVKDGFKYNALRPKGAVNEHTHPFKHYIDLGAGIVPFALYMEIMIFKTLEMALETGDIGYVRDAKKLFLEMQIEDLSTGAR